MVRGRECERRTSGFIRMIVRVSGYDRRGAAHCGTAAEVPSCMTGLRGRGRFVARELRDWWRELRIAGGAAREARRGGVGDREGER